MPANRYGRTRRPATAATPASAGAPVKPASAAIAPEGVKIVKTRVAATPAGEYPYISSELKMIGMLTAAVAIILVVLWAVLK